jgi:cytochrome c oxidase cbb3-type subunit I/II
VDRKKTGTTAGAFFGVILIGIVEMVPTFLIKSNIPTISSVKPYTPLELQGRDIYVREGCYTCHSQMIRPFRSETSRYGEYSKAGEFVYDHPFQWGSKRSGPDLARRRGWQSENQIPGLNHMDDPGCVNRKYSCLRIRLCWTVSLIPAVQLPRSARCRHWRSLSGRL